MKDHAKHAARLRRNFSAVDAWGDSHEYTLQIMPAREALALAPEVARIFGDAIGKLIGAMKAGAPTAAEAPAEAEAPAQSDPFAAQEFGDLPPDPGEMRGLDEGEEEDVFAALGFGGDPLSAFLDAEINGDKIGEAITSLANEFAAAGSYKIAMKLLRHVWRDGVKLDNPLGFDAAFSGNLGELFVALFYSLKHNYASVAAGISAPFAGRRRK